MKHEKIKEIPYGIADYGRIVNRDYYYTDKTAYLKAIEEAGDSKLQKLKSEAEKKLKNYSIDRPDLARLFPGYSNSNGALAYFDFTTSCLCKWFTYDIMVCCG